MISDRPIAMEGVEEGGAAGAAPDQGAAPGNVTADLPFPEVPSRNPIDLLRVPCTVQRVIVRGNKRTKRALIDAELESAMAATTHENLAVELAMATERLDQLDIFKAAECSVDVSSAPDAPDNALDVVLNLEEKGTHTISTGTYMQGGEGNAEVTPPLPRRFLACAPPRYCARLALGTAGVQCSPSPLRI